MAKINSCIGIVLVLSAAAACAHADAAGVSVTFHGPRAVHVVKAPDGAARGRSFAVKAVPSETSAADSEIVVARGADGALSFSTRNGRVLLSEKGAARFPRHRPVKTEYVGAMQSFSVREGEGLFGLGDLENGRLRANGVDERLVPANVGDGIPYVMGEGGWALYWDNSSPTRFTDVPGDSMTFASEAAETVDYWFFYGGSADGCVAEMRALTGDVPMLPLWAYGFWQSRERYVSQEQIVGALQRYRDARIPLDGIIQDWRYWGENENWNAMEFLIPEFPDPKRMVDEIHALHARLLISIWPSFGPKTRPHAAMSARGLFLPKLPTYMSEAGVRYFDGFSTEACDLYYSFLGGFVDLGIDGWWMDATDLDFANSVTFYNRGQEDGLCESYDGMTAAGPLRTVRNAYSLAAVEGVYERTRADPRRKDRRVFILTRGACAGQQRTGAAVWSGDTESNWDSLRRQIPAGCSFSLTGNPNFNCDIGGFGAIHFALGKSAEEAARNPHWQELYVRWMQLGTFLPMMRSHGTSICREIYLCGKPGDKAYDALVAAVKLRYALMPYIYSTAWRCSAERYTMMRPLVMDFPNDRAAVRTTDEFMFGGSLLVAPVVEHAVTSREVHFPAGADWWDYFSGRKVVGGQTRDVAARIDQVPLYVRAGSVLPIGPDVQYNGEKPWDDLELRVYPGADGSFTLYEDDFETYACERGEYSTIRFDWDDAARRLTISERGGAKYPGRIEKRRFRVRLPGREPVPVDYTGARLAVNF